MESYKKKDAIFQTTHFSSSSKPFFTRSFSTKTSSSPSSKSHFTRSFSTKPSSSDLVLPNPFSDGVSPQSLKLRSLCFCLEAVPRNPQLISPPSLLSLEACLRKELR
ncbi:unnamed protein product [Arabidopsis halleri]